MTLIGPLAAIVLCADELYIFLLRDQVRNLVMGIQILFEKEVRPAAQHLNRQLVPHTDNIY